MIVAQTVLYVAVAYGERRKAENRMISFSSDAPNFSQVGEVRPSAPLLPARTLEQAIQDDFATIAEVRGVKVEHENGEMLVRIGVDNPEQALRYKIYDKQASLIEAFPELLFDFSLVSAE